MPKLIGNFVFDEEKGLITLADSGLILGEGFTKKEVSIAADMYERGRKAKAEEIRRALGC